jgi:ATP/ADP translocase
MHLDHRDVALTLKVAAALGLLVSLVSWVLVAVTTPAPVYITGVALAQARVLQERIPEEFGGRAPRNVA